MHVCGRKVIFLAVAFTFFLVPLSVNSFKKSFAISDFNIDAVGDWTCSSNAKSTENNIKAKSPELVLGLGDYSMQPTGTCWFNIIKPTDGITKINFGNHDVESSSLLNSYLNHFHLSGQYYSYNYQNMHILTMATEVSTSSTLHNINLSKMISRRHLKIPISSGLLLACINHYTHRLPLVTLRVVREVVRFKKHIIHFLISIT